MPVATHAKQTMYHSITSHHNWDQKSHHNLRKPKKQHPIWTAILVIVVLAIIIVGFSWELM